MVLSAGRECGNGRERSRGAAPDAAGAAYSSFPRIRPSRPFFFLGAAGFFAGSAAGGPEAAAEAASAADGEAPKRQRSRARAPEAEQAPPPAPEQPKPAKKKGLLGRILKKDE